MALFERIVSKDTVEINTTPTGARYCKGIDLPLESLFKTCSGANTPKTIFGLLT